MTILWDWNGTLLDDTLSAVDALNEMLSKRGLAPIDAGFYRANFAFPVRPFYEAIGVDLDNEDWDALAREYHEAYRRRRPGLNEEAVAALEQAKRRGARQAIVSALRQDLLDEETSRLGVRGYFEKIRGTDNLDGKSKLDCAAELAAAMQDIPSRIVFIGDSLHDKEVADAVGAKCVLFGGGSHSPERLRAAAPTGDSLPHAVELAFAACGENTLQRESQP